MEYFILHGPGDVQGEPVQHTDEQTEFIVDSYAQGFSEEHNSIRRLYDGAFYSRPKGCDKSGLGARFGLYEALGPCRSTGQLAEGGEVYEDPWGLGFSYTYEKGEPLARHVTVPYIRCLATEEGQTGNVYDTIYYNLTEGPLSEVFLRKDDAGLARILLPGGGEITPSTSSSASKDGGKETFVDFDESHLYNRPDLRAMYATVTRNMRKRKKIAETWFLETTTMFAPGEDSIAEQTYKLAAAIKEGQSRRDRLLMDHRWGELPLEEWGDEEKLRAALVEAYGDSLEWNDLSGLVDQFYDPRNSVSDSMRYFLNEKHSQADAWLMENEIRAAAKAGEGKIVADQEMITVGFDGSRGRIRGKPDATALIGCRVSDGYIFELGVWEADDGDKSKWAHWEPPITEIEAKIKETFSKYRVVGFYADPAKDWRSYVNNWEASYGRHVKVRARQGHPFEWWMTGGRSGLVEQAILQLEGALRNGDATISGEFRLVQHLGNSRRRVSHQKLALGKDLDQSPHKIDAAVAAVLAFQARLDAISKGVLNQKREPTIIRVR